MASNKYENRRRYVVKRSGIIASMSAIAIGALSAAAMADRYKVYYLGGQSNMDGYGYAEELPDDLKREIDRVMIFTGRSALDNETGAGVGIWEPLRPGHGTGFKADGSSNEVSDRFGPELSFGSTMTDLDPDARIAIIKYSLGGSGLGPGVGYGSWDPDYADGNRLNQYDHALATIRNALAHADIDGDGEHDQLVPSGIAWMQGESDAYESREVADAYQHNLKRLMNLLRAALRADDLPVAIGKITDSGMAEDGTVMDYIGIVQEAQRAFAEADECAAYVTVTDDIAHTDDAWHYVSEGYVRLGAAFAEALVHLGSTCAD